MRGITLSFGFNLILSGRSLMLEWVLIINSSGLLVFNFYIDWMSTVFFSFVALISSSVLFYRDRYIPKDISYRGFMFLVLIFILRIFFIVFRLNLIRIMLGWDGLGIISYIFVVFYKNEKSRRAGMLTVISNRIGDAALLLRISCFLEIGRWNYIIIDNFMNLEVAMFIILAAITKRAQVPFSSWLPAAMAAPTPVRALVHSSTLVTAGVYLLIRFRGGLQELRELNILVYLGVLTTLMASVGALFEPDFKKVVALSTLRQLGIIVVTLASGLTILAFIHLLTHAVFKALLFMCRGKIIHSVNDSQDIRRIGGGVFNLPITRIVIILSRYALCGVPFLAGFYSKDLIVEIVLMNSNNYINYCLFILIVGLSASYSFRLLFIREIRNINQNPEISRDEEDWTILSSKIILLIIRLVRGALLIWVCLPSVYIIRLVLNLKRLALVRVVLGLLLGVWLCFSRMKGLIFSLRIKVLGPILWIWNLTPLRGIKLGFFKMRIRLKFKYLDLGWLELLRGQGINFTTLNIGNNIEFLALNRIKNILVLFSMVLIILLINISTKSFLEYDIEVIKGRFILKYSLISISVYIINCIQ